MRTKYDVIHSDQPAEDFAEGYPIGNGRIGGMVLGRAKLDRIALNHDLLWRRSFTHQDHHTGEDIQQIAQLCREGKFLEAEHLSRRTVPTHAYYTNPYVPVGDLYIQHINCGAITDYRRELDMDTGVASVQYRCDTGTQVNRESFVSWSGGVLVTHICASQACTLNGEVSLSRLGDDECEVTGCSRPGMIAMDGIFEEGLRFAVRVKILQRGGRVKGGRKTYLPYEQNCPAPWGSEYVYSREEMFDAGRGCSSCFDHADEVLILTAIAVEDEAADGDPGSLAEQRLEKFQSTEDAARLREQSVTEHQALYRRMSLHLDGTADADSEDLLQACIEQEAVKPEMAEILFNFSRYLSICSGRPQKPEELPSAPINLQGIWQQDLRPAWDSDYHLDLNVEMCYWPQNAFGLPELMEPLLQWVERMVPSGRRNALDSFGCEGICFGGCNDYFDTGNSDNVGFLSGASLSAWICQVLWQHWLYEEDRAFLDRLYPIMQEIGTFYEHWLEECDGRLVMPFGTSPEMPILRNGEHTYLASESSFDMELIYDLFLHLTQAAEILCDGKAARYRDILNRVQLPVIGDDGAIREWKDEFPLGSPDHRHRSHLVGLIPGSRISWEKTPDYAQAAWKALQKRHAYGFKGSTSFTFALDGQILARLGKGAEAYDQLLHFVRGYLLPNLLSVTNDFDGKHGGIPWFVGQKLYQIEAQIAIGAVVLEMLFQSRQGILRFLPALPELYAKGSLRGAEAEGGFTVAFTWEQHRVQRAEVASRRGGDCIVKWPDGAARIAVTCDGLPVQAEQTDSCLAFRTEAAKTYHLEFVYGKVTGRGSMET